MLLLLLFVYVYGVCVCAVCVYVYVSFLGINSNFELNIICSKFLMLWSFSREVWDFPLIDWESLEKNYLNSLGNHLIKGWIDFFFLKIPLLSVLPWLLECSSPGIPTKRICCLLRALFLASPKHFFCLF